MKKSMFSKLTSYVVMLCMLLSMFSGLTLSVNAADTVPVTTPSEKHNANQHDGITLMKKAEPNDDGTVDISIGAYTTGEVRSSETAVPTDIVLVLDASGSMEDDISVPVISSYNAVTGGQYDSSFLWWTSDEWYGFSSPNASYYVDVDGTKIPVTRAGRDSGDYDYYTDGINYYYPLLSSGIANNRSELYPVVQFYTAVISGSTTQNKMETLQKGAETFIRMTALKNQGIEKDEDKHTIAIVKYANNSYHNGNSSTSTPSLVVGNRSGYTQLVRGVTPVTAETVEDLVDAVYSLEPYGATAIDYGLRLATEVFASINRNNSDLSEQQDRGEVVIAFTDGVPTHGSSFSTTVANAALSYAQALKAEGVSVYSISMAEGANAKILGTDDTNRFMHFLSSNYPGAASMTNPGTGDIAKGYYMTPDGDHALETIFATIGSNIGVLHAEMGEKATVTDAISSYFDLVDGTESIELKTVAKTADGWADAGEADSSLTYTLGEDGKTIKVSGFDFDENYVSEEARGDSGDFYGKMLLITMHVKPNDAIIDAGVSAHGGKVNTNADKAYVSDSNNISRAQVDSPVLNLAKITYSVTTEGADKAEYASYYRLPGTTQNVIADASKEGYSFKGWATDDVSISDGEFKMPNANIEITGNFVANEYDVTYTYSGTVPADADALLPAKQEDVKFGSTVTVAGAPGLEGYDFVGWRTLADDELVIENGQFTMPARNVTLVGYFEPKQTTPYKIEHYLQNLDGVTYTLDPNIDGRIGTTGERATAVPRLSYTGFTYDSGNENEIKDDVIRADGLTVLKLYYNRNTYSVSYLIDGGIHPAGVSAPEGQTDVMYGAEVEVAENLEAEGYGFSGWSNDAIPTDPNYVEITAGGTFIMPAANVVISGSFANDTDTPYTVEHYLENLDGTYGNGDGALTPAKTEGNFKGETSSTVEAHAVEFTGFTFYPNHEDTVKTATIEPDGSTVLKLYYTRDEYTVKYQYSGVKPADAPELPQGGSYKHGVDVTVAPKATAPDGYDFHGWTLLETGAEVDGTYKMPMRNIVLVGHFHAHDDVPYKIEHYLADVDGTYPALPTYGPEVRPGTTDADATVYAHKYAGFELDIEKTEEVNDADVATVAESSDHTLTMKVKGDGTLVFRFYYKRLPFDVTYAFEGMVPAAVAAKADVYTAPALDVAYGTEMEVNAIDPEDYKGYIFSGWTTDNQHVTLTDGTFTMPAGDVHFKASFTADLNEYVVNHWLQNLDGDTSTGKNIDGKGWYTLADSKTYNDRRTGALVEALPNSYTGFTPRTDNVLSGRIGPGGLVLDVYYDRLTYDVSYFYYDDGTLPENLPDIPASYQKTNVQYGTKLYVEDGMKLDGYNFDGWYTITANVHQDGDKLYYTMPAHNVRFAGRFIKDPVVIYPEDNGGDEPDPEPGEDVVEKGKYIIVNPNGGSWAHDGNEYTEAVKLVMENDRELGIAERDGYIFTGWIRTNGTEEDVVYVYTAQWDKKGGSSPSGSGSNSYILTYESNGGTEYANEKYARNTVVALDKVPEKDGYEFKGWCSDKKLENVVDTIKMTRSLTVYAKWVKEGDDGSGGHHVPGKLDGDNHFAYVIGYPDGTVRPEANITRAEVASIFFRLLVEDVREENLTSLNGFKDFTSDEWYNKAVSTLAALDIIKGKTSDIFAADDNITRAEFAAICARFDDSEFEVVHKFTDVHDHWAADEIHEAIAHGWINGYEDGTFRPDQLITRAEAMTLINRVLSRIPETTDDLLDDMITWVDNADTTAWYYLAIQEATNSHTYFYKDNMYETWRELEEVTDWAAYQK